MAEIKVRWEPKETVWVCPLCGGTGGTVMSANNTAGPYWWPPAMVRAFCPSTHRRGEMTEMTATLKINKPMEVEVKFLARSDGGVMAAMRTSATDSYWCVLELTPRGRLHRYKDVIETLGLDLDEKGRIKLDVDDPLSTESDCPHPADSTPDSAAPAWWAGNDAGVISAANLLRGVAEGWKTAQDSYPCHELTLAAQAIRELRDKSGLTDWIPIRPGCQMPDDGAKVLFHVRAEANLRAGGYDLSHHPYPWRTGPTWNTGFTTASIVAWMAAPPLYKEPEDA